MYANWQSDAYVASFTDAWIETCDDFILHHVKQSHLLQMRGLKHVHDAQTLHTPSRIFYRCVD